MSEATEKRLQEALEALEAGRRKEAADLLKDVVEDDTENVDAWVALSMAVDDTDEKRIALTTILQLDPDNEFAKQALEQAEQKETEVRDQTEVIAGVTNRQARMIGLGLAAYTLVVCGLAFMITNGINGGRAAATAEAATLVAQPIVTQTALAIQGVTATAEASEEAFYETQTAVLTITPTATASRTPDLPPTETPTAEVTEASARAFPTPPIEAPGSIYAWGGRNNTSRDFLELRRYQVNDGGNYSIVNDDLVQEPQQDSSGQTITYVQFVPQGLQDVATIYQVNANDPSAPGNDFTLAVAQGGALDPLETSLAENGTVLAFTGRDSATLIREVFLLDIAANTVTKLTSDEATYKHPAVSPDGNFIVAVRESDDDGTDLVLIDRAALGGTVPEGTAEPGAFPGLTFLTQDGNANIEAHPVFAPDGAQIAFSVAGANGVDIHVQRFNATDGSSAPLISSPADETYPVFSPSGQFIAYASNQTGVFNIFVYDLQTATIYQLTEEMQDDVYPGDWGP